MRFKKLLILACLALPMQMPLAHAVSVSAVGGLGISRPNMTMQPGFSMATNLAFGGGLLFGFAMAPKFGLELGALYIPKKPKVTSSLGNIVTTVNSLNVPLLFRLNLPYISFGAGGYYARGLGKITAESTLPGVSNTTMTFSEANTEENDFGFAGSIQFKLPLGPKLKFLIDGRYLYGMKDLNKGTDTLKNRDIQTLAGLSFGM